MTVDNINKLIDYCIKIPEKDEYEVGYRYPYYSCELLCSVNGLNLDKLLSTYPEENIENNTTNQKEELKDKNEIKEENKDKEINNVEIEKEEKSEEETEKKDNEIDNNNKDINNNEIKKEENKKEEKNEEIINEDKNLINDANKEKDKKTENKEENIEEKDKIIEDNNNIKEENKKDENEINTENEEKENKENSNIEQGESNKDEKAEDNNKEIKEKEEEAKMEIEDSIPAKKEIKEEKAPNIPLVYSILEHIFSFLDNKSSIENTVLLGYFNKIVNYLIKTRTKLILAYFLIQKDTLIPKLIKNINKISISNIISNILNALTEENSPEANEEYMIIVNECINYLSKIENNNEEDINTFEFICDLIINHIIYNNKLKFSKIIDANIINKIEKIIIKLYENYEQNNSKILCLINLLTKMNKSLLANFSKKITTTTNSDDTKLEMLNLINSVDRTSNQFVSFTTKKNDFKELVYNSFQNNYIIYCNSINNICLAVLNNKLKQNQNNPQNIESIITSYSDQPKEKYKSSNLIEYEFIVSIIDIYVNLLNAFFENETKSNFIIEKIVQITNTNFFKFLLDDYLKFKQNNFLSNIMLDLIKIVFENNIAPKELLLNILQLDSKETENNNTNLILLLINDLINNTKYTFENSNNITNQLSFSSNVMILKLIFSSTNPNIYDIFNKMEKEKFFYKYFITNIYSIYSKKLYKTDTNDNAIDKINSLGIRLGFGNTLTQSNTNIAFSLESINSIIEFNLKLYDKYIKGEEYEYLFDERNKRLEEIKKSKEYIKLNKIDDDELEEEEKEEEDINDINIPKPEFYNSKIDKKLEENNERDNITNDSDNNNEESQNEDKAYNDVNYWHIEVKDDNFENLINDL